MKKYLFLLCLFIVYLILIGRNSTTEVISYDDKHNDGVIDVSIKFENGINSNKLNGLFKKYKQEYYVHGINTKKNKFNVSCYKIDECLKDIYNQEDNLFDANYVTHGFSINELNVMAYSDEMILFLNENNLEYKINKE